MSRAVLDPVPIIQPNRIGANFQRKNFDDSEKGGIGHGAG
jgi:hypothetical protein